MMLRFPFALFIAMFCNMAWAVPGVLQVYCKVFDFDETGTTYTRVGKGQRWEARFFPDKDHIPDFILNKKENPLYAIVTLRAPDSGLRVVLDKIAPQAFKDCDSRYIFVRADVVFDEASLETATLDGGVTYFYANTRSIALKDNHLFPENAMEGRIPKAWNGGYLYEEYVKATSRDGKPIRLRKEINGTIEVHSEPDIYGERLLTEGDWMYFETFLHSKTEKRYVRARRYLYLPEVTVEVVN
jgi:hypothetical protein